MHIGGQEHFYLETNCTIAVPRGEDGEMELFVSTQSASKTQVKTLLTPAAACVCIHLKHQSTNVYYSQLSLAIIKVMYLTLLSTK